VIKLYGLGRAWELPDISAFVAKVDCYLRMAGVRFQNVHWQPGDPAPPKGKFPFIEDGNTRIADSDLIIEYMKRTYGDPLDCKLSPQQKAVALAMRRMIEEHLYWPLVFSQWGEDAAWAGYQKMLPTLAAMPSTERTRHRDYVLGQVFAQGTGRHSRAEIYQLGNADLSALSRYLERKPFFMGDEPCSLDATTYAFLTRIMWVPELFGSPLKTHAQSLSNLPVYCERMRERYYRDSDRAAGAEAPFDA
jgi:glutathione S-transferase